MSDKRRRSVLAFAVAAALLAFFPPFWALRPQAAFEFLNSLLVSCGIGVWISYSRGLWEALTVEPRHRTAGDHLIIGIMLEATGLIIVFGNLWWFRVSGDGDVLNHWSAGFGRWTVFIGAMFHLAASRAVEDRVPETAYLKAGIWAAFGVMGALVLLGLGIE